VSTPQSAPGLLPPVSDAEFRAFQTLIYEEAGIHLNANKRALLAGRLARRVRELGFGRLREYHDYVSSHAEERVRMLDRITTNETSFFREPRQFELLEARLLPEWRAAAAAGTRPRRIRVWSAGCSSGEEPFSLAMVLLSCCPPADGWDIEIVASDLSTRVLERAQSATFSEQRAARIPRGYLERYMLRGVRSQQGFVKAAPELRERIRFERVNLIEDNDAVSGKFDLIFCRNVLIYFDAASKAQVLRRLTGQLQPGGYLFLGHAESLARTESRMKPVAPNVYRAVAA
jgi:chemotaxis protein methyltransferase CheR